MSRKKDAVQVELNYLNFQVRRLAMHEIGFENLQALSADAAQAAVEEAAATTVRELIAYVERSIQEAL